MSTKLAWSISGVTLALCGFLAYNTYTVQRDNQRLSLINSINQAEYRILKDEIASLERQPKYDEGYKAAIIRMGGPQTPGAYQDGWDDAMKVIGAESNYADGYHAAIQQFGYTKTAGMTRWLAPEPKIAETKKTDGSAPAKFEKK